MAVSKTVFVDTSALYALVNKADQDHTSALRCIEDISQNHLPVLISNFIFDEIYTLLLTKMGRTIATEFGERLREEWIIESVSFEDEEIAWNIITKNADKNYSYTDATSFAIMKRLGLTTAFTYDHHFSQHGMTVIPDQ